MVSGVAIFANLYRRLNRAPEAEMPYRKALSMSRQEPERRYLTRRLSFKTIIFERVEIGLRQPTKGVGQHY